MAVLQLPAPVARRLSRRVDVFTASGTWTAPAGVTYAIAFIRGGGGGGGGATGRGGAGGSSAALGSTVAGGYGGNPANNAFMAANAAPVNSGLGGHGSGRSDNNFGISGRGGAGCLLPAGGTVTPGTGYTITIGAGGAVANDSGLGGSGFVFIEYEVQV